MFSVYCPLKESFRDIFAIHCRGRKNDLEHTIWQPFFGGELFWGVPIPTKRCVEYIADSAPGTHCMTNSVQSRRQPSSKTRRNRYDAAGALACARRCSDVTRCSVIDMPPLRHIMCTMTLPIRTDMHNVLQGRRRTGPRPSVTCKKFVEDRRCSSEDMLADGQTDRQTHRQTCSSQHRYSATPLRQWRDCGQQKARPGTAGAGAKYFMTISSLSQYFLLFRLPTFLGISVVPPHSVLHSRRASST